MIDSNFLNPLALFLFGTMFLTKFDIKIKGLVQPIVQASFVVDNWCGSVESRQCSEKAVWQAGGVAGRQCGEQAVWHAGVEV